VKPLARARGNFILHIFVPMTCPAYSQNAVLDNFRVAYPTRNGPIWYERSTNMRRPEDWILVGVTAVFRQ